MIKNIQKITKSIYDIGCGETLGIKKIKRNEVVLIIGSGNGVDCFLASEKVGKLGKVIGIDKNTDVIRAARSNALKKGHINIEFKLGHIENLPVRKNSIDVIISHCTINLVPDKSKVYRKIYSVLKKGGRMYVSDLVLLEKTRGVINPVSTNDCINGSSSKRDYLGILKDCGFKIKAIPKTTNQPKRIPGNTSIERLNLVIQK